MATVIGYSIEKLSSSRYFHIFMSHWLHKCWRFFTGEVNLFDKSKILSEQTFPEWIKCQTVWSNIVTERLRKLFGRFYQGQSKWKSKSIYLTLATLGCWVGRVYAEIGSEFWGGFLDWSWSDLQNSKEKENSFFRAVLNKH